MTDDCGDFDPDDLGDDYAELLDDLLADSPPPPSAMQQGMLLGPALLAGPYQRGSGSFPTVRLYDAEGHELVWQEIDIRIEEILRIGNTVTIPLTFGVSFS